MFRKVDVLFAYFFVWKILSHWMSVCLVFSSLLQEWLSRNLGMAWFSKGQEFLIHVPGSGPSGQVEQEDITVWVLQGRWPWLINDKTEDNSYNLGNISGTCTWRLSKVLREGKQDIILYLRLCPPSPLPNKYTLRLSSLNLFYFYFSISKLESIH